MSWCSAKIWRILVEEKGGRFILSGKLHRYNCSQDNSGKCFISVSDNIPDNECPQEIVRRLMLCL